MHFPHLALALSLSLLTSTALIHPNLQPRQSGPDPASAADQFSSAAAQLISLYIPPTLAVPFGVAVQSAASAASISGDINSIEESALTAATPPAFLSALPTVYSSNVLGLESALSALRGAASTGVAGAARVTTGTDSSGSTFTSTVPGATGAAGVVVVTTTDSKGATVTSMETSAATGMGNATGSAAVLVLTLSNTLGSTYVSSTTVVVPMSGSNGMAAMATTTTVAAVVVTTTDSAGATVTSTQSAPSSSSMSASASSSTPPPSSSAAPPPSSSSKSGFAAPTHVPIAAAGAGVLGLVGLLAAL